MGSGSVASARLSRCAYTAPHTPSKQIAIAIFFIPSNVAKKHELPLRHARLQSSVTPDRISHLRNNAAQQYPPPCSKTPADPTLNWRHCRPGQLRRCQPQAATCGPNHPSTLSSGTLPPQMFLNKECCCTWQPVRAGAGPTGQQAGDFASTLITRGSRRKSYIPAVTAQNGRLYPQIHRILRTDPRKTEDERRKSRGPSSNQIDFEDKREEKSVL